MNKALIVIDYTNDFVAEDGALTCGAPGRAIEGSVLKLCEEFSKNGDFIVFAVDKHEANDARHPESKLFPPHNISGAEGRKQYGALEQFLTRHIPDENVYYMDKTRYSSFAGTDLYLRLTERGVRELHVCGVCTDICVLHTLVDGYNYGFKLVVHESSVASFDADGHAWALRHFKGALGAEIV